MEFVSCTGPRDKQTTSETDSGMQLEPICCLLPEVDSLFRSCYLEPRLLSLCLFTARTRSTRMLRKFIDPALGRPLTPVNFHRSPLAESSILRPSLVLVYCYLFPLILDVLFDMTGDNWGLPVSDDKRLPLAGYSHIKDHLYILSLQGCTSLLHLVCTDITQYADLFRPPIHCLVFCAWKSHASPWGAWHARS